MTTSFPGAAAISRLAATRTARASAIPAATPLPTTRFNSRITSVPLELDLTTSREADNKASREYHRNIRRGVVNSIRESKVPM